MILPLEVFDNFLTFFIVTAREGCATGIWWVEIRDTVKHPTVHSSLLPSTHTPHKNYLALNVNCSKVEKPSFRLPADAKSNILVRK